MKTSEEIRLWEKLKRIVAKDYIHSKHGIKEMDLNCPECEAAMLIGFINKRLDFLRWVKKNP